MEIRRYPNRLKKFRRLFCFSQKQVARLLGLADASLLSRWEKGKSVPSLVYLFRLARIYKTMPTEMYTDLWQTIIKEMAAEDSTLSAQHGPITPNHSSYL